MIDVKPYVYRLEHKNTKQFYYGVRMANVVPAHEDLFVRYFSSSKHISSIGPENFLYEVLQEFDSRTQALEKESELIRETINDSLSLNKMWVGKEKFYFHNKGKPHSEEHKRKISESNKGKHSNNGASRPEVRLKNSESNKGKIIPQEVLDKRAATRRGVPRPEGMFDKKTETQRLKNGGHYFSEDARRRISESRKLKKKDNSGV